jgi:nucleoside 2-deoxyribosyltransferase
MKIFLGAPFSDYFDGKEFNKDMKQTIENIVKALKQDGHTVRSAHLRENFGDNLMKAEMCTPLDYQEILDCDLFVAIPSNPISGGVHIELGWASALQKQVLLCLNDNDTYSPLIHGLHTVGKSDKVFFKSVEQLPKLISNKINDKYGLINICD